MQGVHGRAATVDDVAPSTGWRGLADITFVAYQDRANVGSATSDRGGWYHLELPVGTYQLHVGLTTSAEFAIADGAAVDVDFEGPFGSLHIAPTESGPIDVTTCD